MPIGSMIHLIQYNLQPRQYHQCSQLDQRRHNSTFVLAFVFLKKHILMVVSSDSSYYLCVTVKPYL